MFDNFGRIVEAKIKAGQHEAFEAVMKKLVQATLNEEGTLNYRFPDNYWGCVIPPQADSSRRRTKSTTYWKISLPAFSPSKYQNSTKTSAADTMSDFLE